MYSADTLSKMAHQKRKEILLGQEHHRLMTVCKPQIQQHRNVVDHLINDVQRLISQFHPAPTGTHPIEKAVTFQLHRT